MRDRVDGVSGCNGSRGLTATRLSRPGAYACGATRAWRSRDSVPSSGLGSGENRRAGRNGAFSCHRSHLRGEGFAGCAARCAANGCEWWGEGKRVRSSTRTYGLGRCTEAWYRVYCSMRWLWAHVAQEAEHNLGKIEVPGSSPGVGSRSRCSSAVEQLFRKQQVVGSNPTTGSP